MRSRGSSHTNCLALTHPLSLPALFLYGSGGHGSCFASGSIPVEAKVRWAFLVKSHFFANHQNYTKLATDLERRKITETPAVPTAHTHESDSHFEILTHFLVVHFAFSFFSDVNYAMNVQTVLRIYIELKPHII